jgi:TfoX/Sxy family transcriptional regulator of competence genes
MNEPVALQALLEAACNGAEFPAPVRFRAMFGGITGYVGERNFASLSNVGLALKLSKADREALILAGGKPLQYEPDATPSKSAVVVPASILENTRALGEWALKSARHVQALAPPKPRRQRIRET